MLRGYNGVGEAADSLLATDRQEVDVEVCLSFGPHTGKQVGPMDRSYLERKAFPLGWPICNGTPTQKDRAHPSFTSGRRDTRTHTHARTYAHKKRGQFGDLSHKLQRPSNGCAARGLHAQQPGPCLHRTRTNVHVGKNGGIAQRATMLGQGPEDPVDEFYEAPS